MQYLDWEWIFFACGWTQQLLKKEELSPCSLIVADLALVLCSRIFQGWKQVVGADLRLPNLTELAFAWELVPHKR